MFRSNQHNEGILLNSRSAERSDGNERIVLGCEDQRRDTDLPYHVQRAASMIIIGGVPIARFWCCNRVVPSRTVRGPENRSFWYRSGQSSAFRSRVFLMLQRKYDSYMRFRGRPLPCSSEVNSCSSYLALQTNFGRRRHCGRSNLWIRLPMGFASSGKRRKKPCRGSTQDDRR